MPKAIISVIKITIVEIAPACEKRLERCSAGTYISALVALSGEVLCRYLCHTCSIYLFIVVQTFPIVECCYFSYDPKTCSTDIFGLWPILFLKNDVPKRAFTVQEDFGRYLLVFLVFPMTNWAVLWWLKRVERKVVVFGWRRYYYAFELMWEKLMIVIKTCVQYIYEISLIPQGWRYALVLLFTVWYWRWGEVLTEIKYCLFERKTTSSGMMVQHEDLSRFYRDA